MNKKNAVLSFFITGLLSACSGTSNDPMSEQQTEQNAPQTPRDPVIKTTAAGIETPSSTDNLFPTMEHVVKQDWQLISSLSDEFNASSINHSKWGTDIGDWGPWSWEPSNTKQADGKLKITMQYAPHTTKRRASSGDRVDVDLFYTSGIARTKGKLTYGYYEARIKGIHTFPAASPAFWTYSVGQGNDGMAEGTIKYSEVDVIEMQQGEWSNATKSYNGSDVLDMNLHTRVVENGKIIWKRPGKYPELTKNEVHVKFDPKDDFHIYGAEVTPETITWYLDGEQVAQKPNVYWHLPMHVTLSLGLRRPHVTYNNCPHGFDRCAVASEATAIGFPTTMEVDWVRVYKRKD
ncbi:glycoside hydrolase family 16 [Saccharobesus litoralis]|uniref:Glycoside hydrolase family 16 n=1 Tax=Saccharobesus litoralis TaxID=2172099 RepID=A0A2S0VM56_9ALTE|nr:kappa-carrageenase [Saccharobesus litoralis]AWB65294.1 glycoside hydrolase family 16 [Saccharobesus litoralis]